MHSECKWVKDWVENEPVIARFATGTEGIPADDPFRIEVTFFLFLLIADAWIYLVTVRCFSCFFVDSTSLEDPTLIVLILNIMMPDFFSLFISFFSPL